MSTETHSHHGPETLADQVQEHTGVKAARCYQCGKCTAGCPMAAEMDYPPSLLLRMLQTGLPEMEEKVLRSFTIWLCLTCETCIARCPMEVDLPKVMDYLRGESLRRRISHPKAKDIISFHRAFLDSIEKTGRLFEVGLIADYKVRSLHLLQDVLVAPKMFFKGKLGVFPELVKDRPSLARIFRRTIGKEETK